MDNLSKKHRSWLMSRIRSKDTKPETIVRSMLHQSGFRFSLRTKDLPGRPDIKLTKYKTVIFVHGCFWHRHPGCRRATTPKTNKSFWQNKFEGNVRRDRRNQRDLRKLGWKVIVVWECRVLKDPESVLNRIVRELAKRNADLPNRSRLYIIDRSHLLRVAETKLQYGLRKADSDTKQ
ncbi:MAG: DNA mismatch endonuclease Vsr [Proteobacteria bacterium]|nr:DNA mismatch endonuclease Vsr [Pseudomonadota bacterium]